MPTGRSYSLDDLKSALKTRVAEFEMLNKTLIESIERGSSEVTLDAIKDAIKDAEENIKVLRDWIEEKTNKEEETNKVFQGQLRLKEIKSYLKLRIILINSKTSLRI